MTAPTRLAWLAAALALALPAAPAAVHAQAGGAAKPAPRVLAVGPARELKMPSAAARIAQRGDVIEIDPGTYADCAVWRADNITIRGGGKAHVKDVSCDGRGIWIIWGRNTTVDGIEFSGADVQNNNGAAIVHEGINMVVRNSHFHDNEQGILTAHRSDSMVTVIDSRFERNGKCEPECAHGIYAGRIRSLRVFGSTFREQHVGHHIKSRALYTEVVGCHLEDGIKGTTSYVINLPNGGDAVIRQNYLQKGPNAHNRMALISIGEEGASNPGKGYRIEGNTFRNDFPGATTFVRNASPQPATLRANAFTGQGQPLTGAGQVVK